jgi:hypothetical protein
MISFPLQDGMGYSPYSLAMTPWTLTLWRGDYTKMMQQLKGLQVNRRLVISVADQGCLSWIQSHEDSGSRIRIRITEF